MPSVELRPYPTYKESGVDWIGEVPINWDVSALRHRYSQCLGKMLDSKRNTGNNQLPYLRNTDVQWDRINVDDLPTMEITRHEYDRYTVQTGDLLVCEGGEVGRCALWSGNLTKCGFQKALHRLRPLNEKHDLARYMYYALSVASNRQAFNDGHLSTIAHLTGEKLRKHPFPFPSFAEQTAIARFLDHADERIQRYVRAKQKLIALLEEQKQAVIHQAVTGQIDVQTGQPYVTYKPSEVGWLHAIPKHWGKTSLDAATHSIQTGPFGSQLHASEYVRGGIPVINPSHMFSSTLMPDHSVSVSQEKADELSRHYLCAGDIVMARRGEVGRCALVTEREAGWLCGTGSLRIRPISRAFANRYLLLVLSASGVRNSLTLASIGATMDNLNAEIVSRLRLPLPPIAEQSAIVEFVDKSRVHIDAAIDGSRREIKLLREYWSAVVARAVTGMIDVREVAHDLPEVDTPALVRGSSR